VNKAIADAESFFRNLTQSEMSEPERTLYNLKIERESLVRRANEYARALNQIEQYSDKCSTRLETRRASGDLHGRRYHDKAKRQAAAHQRAMAKLNADFPLGNCAEELRAINVEIAKATAALHRSWLDNRKPGEYFSTFKINSGGVN
jgi:hypothetical protein